MTTKPKPRPKCNTDIEDKLVHFIDDSIEVKMGTLPKPNKISVCDVSVESCESLERCLEAIDRLIQRHTDFVLSRRNRRHLDLATTDQADYCG